ncbi:hypothetical protein C5Y96_00685 [Blastopirellula marina]|uniref:Uncharacterized protein n=1 Tax=Blastopirellula marina TaxID=124 RepID=A0A2S8G9X0_9BACT|nr:MULTISPECIES: hypothetical protein [Pirellulaceae]PQO41262.1 hypothetical protein C5Y96_00685 [Blastopirellula marina]RCS56286.1 hypothetical protein DTL36_00685 [Bremerella cremea]
MTTEPTNPFASPQADITTTGRPEVDQAYPMTATAPALIEDVPEPHHRTVRTFKMRFLLGLPNVVIPITLGILFYGMAAFGPAWLDLGGNASLALLIGSMATFFTLIYVLTNAFRQDYWWEMFMRRQIASRPAPWISLSAHPSEFVTLTSTQPKSMASFQLGSNEAEIIDIGLIQLDKTEGVMVLECDNRRYRIPRNSLLACDVQQIKLQSPWTPVVMIACQTDEGPHEFCIMPADDHPWLEFAGRYRKRQAERLAQEIYELPRTR